MLPTFKTETSAASKAMRAISRAASPSRIVGYTGSANYTIIFVGFIL